MQAKLIIKFETLSEAEFHAKLEHIVTSLTGNPNFPVPWPAGVVSLSTLTTDAAAYNAAYEGAKNGDKVKIKVRKEARTKVTGDLKAIAPYLELVANHSVAVLGTSGYDLRHDLVKPTTHPVPSEPSGYKVSRGKLGGQLIVHATADAAVDSYEVQVASADPSVEANWGASTIATHCNHIELTGLVAGHTYYVRLRGNNKSGHGPWATSAGVMVV